MNYNCKKSAFTLIELMVVVVIISVLLIYSINAYSQYIAQAKISRAKADLNELAKSIRLYNIREDNPFKIATFSTQDLGIFVGTYLEKDPPKDPWGNYYLHDYRKGMLYSKGPNKVDNVKQIASGSMNEFDDIVMRYLPEKLFITRAKYVDANLDNQIDFGDYIQLRFSKPAKIEDASVFDFTTKFPDKALGSAVVRKMKDPVYARIIFSPPTLPSLRLGETTIAPRDFIESITDYSEVPKRLVNVEDVVIRKSR